MKKIVTIVLGGIFLLGNSCSDSYLDVDPKSSLTDAGFYKTEADAIASVNGVYDAYQKEGSGRATWHRLGHGITGDTRSNNAVFNNLVDLNYDPNNGQFLNLWNFSYIGIARANTTIDRVAAMTNISDDVKNQVVGQATFLRGLFYYQLARGFGDVPLLTREQTGADDPFVSRTPVAEVYEQIKQDFRNAANMLPVSWDAANLGRATKGAALGMLVKAHLEVEEYADAVTVSEELIDLNVYSLVPDMMDNWNVDSENGPESVFELQFRDGPNAGGWGDNNEGHYNNQEFAPAGVGEYAVVGGWGNYWPAPGLDAHFEDGDMRRPWQILAVGEKHRNADYVLNNGGTPSNLVYQKYWFGPWTQQQPGGQYNPLNLPYLRYAEVLINYAEALNEVGRHDDAIIQINKLRERAGATPDGVFKPRPASSDKDEILDWIFYERRVEFVNEFSFYFDLKRRGRFKDFREENYDDGEKVLDHYRYFPIPSFAIATNFNLVQTPGY